MNSLSKSLLVARKYCTERGDRLQTITVFNFRSTITVALAS